MRALGNHSPNELTTHASYYTYENGFQRSTRIKKGKSHAKRIFRFSQAHPREPQSIRLRTTGPEALARVCRSFTGEVRTDTTETPSERLIPAVLRGSCSRAIARTRFLIRYIDERVFCISARSAVSTSPSFRAGGDHSHLKRPYSGSNRQNAHSSHQADDRRKGRRSTTSGLTSAQRTKQEAGSVAIGDPVTFACDLLELRKDVYAARGFDDRIGSFIVAE